MTSFQTISRRTILGSIAALPVIGAGATMAAIPVVAAIPKPINEQISDLINEALLLATSITPDGYEVCAVSVSDNGIGLIATSNSAGRGCSINITKTTDWRMH